MTEYIFSSRGLAVESTSFLHQAPVDGQHDGKSLDPSDVMTFYGDWIWSVIDEMPPGR
jgi:hypothetical protein